MSDVTKRRTISVVELARRMREVPEAEFIRAFTDQDDNEDEANDAFLFIAANILEVEL